MTSHDSHMTVTWLSHDFTWLSHDCHMIYQQWSWACVSIGLCCPLANVQCVCHYRGMWTVRLLEIACQAVMSEHWGRKEEWKRRRSEGGGGSRRREEKEGEGRERCDRKMGRGKGLIIVFISLSTMHFQYSLPVLECRYYVISFNVYTQLNCLHINKCCW